MIFHESAGCKFHKYCHNNRDVRTYRAVPVHFRKSLFAFGRCQKPALVVTCAASLSQGSRDLAQHRLDPNNLSVHLLNGSITALGHVVVGDDLQSIADVMVQIDNPLQSLHHCLITFANVSKNLEDQEAHRECDRCSGQD